MRGEASKGKNKRKVANSPRQKESALKKLRDAATHYDKSMPCHVHAKPRWNMEPHVFREQLRGL